VSARILVVEDEPDIARLLGLKLKQEGLEPVFAGDAVTAVTIARKEDPDLIVVDLGLPGGGGVLVMERLRAIATLALKPVIVISAREPIESAQQAQDAGAVAFFPKPLDLDGLVATIRVQLGE
jgi:DNA-binding response OmpR family regulator